MTQSVQRPLVGLSGLVLTGAGLYGLWVFGKLVGFIVSATDSAELGWDYVPLGLALICVVAAGLSLCWSAWHGRDRDLIPGPTLYLLGLFLIVLAVQAWMVSGSALYLTLIIAGLGLIVMEYQLDVL